MPRPPVPNWLVPPRPAVFPPALPRPMKLATSAESRPMKPVVPWPPIPLLRPKLDPVPPSPEVRPVEKVLLTLPMPEPIDRWPNVPPTDDEPSPPDCPKPDDCPKPEDWPKPELPNCAQASLPKPRANATAAAQFHAQFSRIRHRKKHASRRGKRF